MARSEAAVQKVFTAAYILDRAKLSRILGIVEQRFSELELPYAPRFEVRLKNGKVIQLADVQHVFDLDNAVKNPIHELEITAGMVVKGAFLLKFDSDRHLNMRLRVESANAKWANQLFAEVEEQVERTIPGKWPYAVTTRDAIHLVPMVLALLLTLVALLFVPTKRPNNGFSTSADIEHLRVLSASARTIDQKVDFLFESRRLEIARLSRKADTPQLSDYLEPHYVLMALPVIVIVGCIAYMFFFLYPWAVFLWGDFEEHYKKMVGRRRAIWTIVVAALIVGILGNLFVVGLARFLPKA
ncbi:MAG TPA: hypothetical protein VGB92_17350 [Longimicrobium sp.]|jgi:hypothetical protein